MKRHYGEVHANQYSKKSCIGPKSWRSCHAQTDRTDFPSSAEIFSARKPWRYNYRSSSRSHFTGIEDDLTDAFVDAEFPHETASIGSSAGGTNKINKHVKLGAAFALPLIQIQYMLCSTSMIGLVMEGAHEYI